MGRAVVVVGVKREEEEEAEEVEAGLVTVAFVGERRVEGRMKALVKVTVATPRASRGLTKVSGAMGFMFWRCVYVCMVGY
jgi:hypothetical protein